MLKKCLTLLMMLGTLAIPAAAGIPPQVEPGMLAPPLSLKSINHGQVNLAEFGGHPVFVSFISTDQAAPSLSRSQIVFLKSIFEQYGSVGVKVLLIDAPSVDSRQPPEPESLFNFCYDWELDNIPLLRDAAKGSVAHRYGVRQLPTTFLVGEDGFMADRWDSLATTAQLAMALHESLRTSETTLKIIDDCSGAVLRRAIFPGLPPIRQLGEHIWVVEDQEPWKTGQAKTLRWVILRSESDYAQKRIRLLVTAKMHGIGEARTLLDVIADPLPDEEALLLTESLAASFAGVYLTTGTLTVQEAGCHELETRVFDDVSGLILTQGRMSISVK
ncbi:MAG TPA: redoxin domain-containing protein [Acidobacteriota bacterium]|nr:redoxin domain-containing protein [Acidobacteriota bacterium]